jgi:hypothetical protein
MEGLTDFDWQTTDTETEFVGFTAVDIEKTQARKCYRQSVESRTVDRTWTSTVRGTHALMPAFRGPQPGPTHPLSADAPVVDWFYQIFDEELIAYIVRCTNRYARQRRRARPVERRRSPWTPVSAEEMKAFLGISVLFGCVRQPEIPLYWSGHPVFGHELVRKTFPRDRFKLILRYLYYSKQDFCQPDSRRYEEMKAAETVNRMLKVQQVRDRINANSRAARNPRREMAVDEGTIPYRGRSKNVTFNPAKPHKYGIKVYTLSESASGYVFNDEIHQTNAEHMHPLEYRSRHDPTLFLGNKPGQVVNRLATPYLGNWHHIIVDNYYTSAVLFDHLYSNGTLATGTCKSLTTGIPEEMRHAKKMKVAPLFCPPDDRANAAKWPRGSYTTLQSRGQRDRGPMTVTAWSDTKIVTFLSTAINPLLNCRRMARNSLTRRSKDKQGRYVKRRYPCPEVAIAYNAYFKGVDLTDQMLSYYPPGRTSPRWHRSVFYHELNKALLNAYLNWADAMRVTAKDRHFRQITFRSNVAVQLIGDFTARKRPVYRTTGRDRSVAPPYVERAEHRLEKSGRRRTCVMCRQARPRRGYQAKRFRVHETSWWCATCQVAVCGVAARRICWDDHNV